MTLDRVNWLNIGLMLASLGAALVVPFELFLFSYAVLGPLHYLTEISWLHDRKYFLPTRLPVFILVALTVLVALTSDVVFEIGNDPLGVAIAAWGPEFRVGALGLAGVFVVAHGTRSRGIGVLAVLGCLVVVHFANQSWRASGEHGLAYTAYDLFFLLFLTTIVHVFVFTGVFVLLGALRSRSLSGMLSMLVFLGCAAACFVVPIGSPGLVSDGVRSAYDASSTALNLFLARLVDPDAMPSVDHVFTSPMGEMMARFIAYAYTYHYLNWFSKTSVIGWHEVSRVRLLAVGSIWLASLGVYAWNYLLGLSVLFFLSMLHVFLEFPLNWRSFIDIGRELRFRVLPRPG